MRRQRTTPSAARRLARNVISGNTFSGVTITGSGTSGNVVLGNYIGIDFNDTAAPGDGLGVFVAFGAFADLAPAGRRLRLDGDGDHRAGDGVLGDRLLVPTGRFGIITPTESRIAYQHKEYDQ